MDEIWERGASRPLEGKMYVERKGRLFDTPLHAAPCTTRKPCHAEAAEASEREMADAIGAAL